MKHDPTHLEALNSDDRATRLSRSSYLVRAPKGSVEASLERDVAQQLWDDPKIREKLKSMQRQTRATFDAQQANGAGYPADEALREFQCEYMSRLVKHGMGYMPQSFDIMEAFFSRGVVSAGLFLLNETDYLISVTDFLDYVTQPDAPPPDLSLASSIPANAIVNVNSGDALDSLLLGTDHGHDFAVQAASYVRRGDEIAMLLVLGEHLPPEDARLLEKATTQPLVLRPGRADLDLSDRPSAGVVYLDEKSHLSRTLALCRFNLKERRLEARCLLRDAGDRYIVLTDIPRASQDDAVAAEEVSRLDEVPSVWETAKLMLLLPAYLAARIELVEKERRSTRLGLELRNSLKARKEAEHALAASRIMFKYITAVRVPRAPQLDALVGRAFVPPAFQVEVHGYWRTLEPGQKGHDAKGNDTEGRTWVKPHVRYKDKEAPPERKIVFIKSSLAEARRRQEER
ncbi:hypothetical protein [Paraburkholderia youngii]|uniref:hypothetical protein n=1 Tax=Paraburkholderia youngii TaxID=2782701 RepID=UPI003D21DFAF